MTSSELAEEVWSCLPTEAQDRISLKDVHLVIKLIFETIIERLLVGDDIRIRNFGRIWAAFYRGGRKFWCEPVQRMVVRKSKLEIKFKPSKRVHRMVDLARNRMNSIAMKEAKKDMDKYGYEQEKKDEKVKEASESGKCPKCGSALSGNPPVCPKCGSEPFERK